MGNAGTLLRLLPGWLAAQEGRSFTLDGDDSIRRRPVDRIAEPLRQMGAELQAKPDKRRISATPSRPSSKSKRNGSAHRSPRTAEEVHHPTCNRAGAAR